MDTIPDFTDTEQNHINAILLERYGKIIPVQLADSELQLGGDSSGLTPCPTVYWFERGAHFVVCKTGIGRYRCMFYYSDAEQFGTGHEEYDNIDTCVITLLQVQSDHERQLANISSGATAATLKHDDYDGPLVV